MKKINFTIIEYTLLAFVIIFAIALYFSQTFIDKLSSSNEVLQKTQTEFKSISDLYISIDKIKFDTSVFQNSFFENIFTLPEFPLDTNSGFIFGKPDPFSGSFIVVPNQTSDVQGGIRSTAQTFASTTIITNFNSTSTAP